MDIQLHHLSNADKEAFVEGFATAAAMDFPHFDAERDALRDEPWSRPWQVWWDILSSVPEPAVPTRGYTPRSTWLISAPPPQFPATVCPWR